MKRKKIFIKVVLFFLVFSSISILSTGKTYADEDWWHSVTVTWGEVRNQSGVYTIPFSISEPVPQPSIFEGDYKDHLAVRLTVNSQLITEGQQIDNVKIPKGGWYAHSAHDDQNCGSASIDNVFITGEHPGISDPSFRINYIDDGTKKNYEIVDLKPDTGIRKYYIEVYGVSGCGIDVPAQYLKIVFNVPLKEYRPQGSETSINDKLKIIDQTYGHWRDLVLGDCGADLYVDPFLFPESEACEGGVENPQKLNLFWEEETGVHVLGRQYYNDLITKITGGLSGTPKVESTTFYLTDKGKTRYAEIQSEAQALIDYIDELDSQGISNDDIKNATQKVMIRHWNTDLDQADVIFQSWDDKDGLKTRIYKMKNLFEKAIEDLSGEKGTCMNALTAGNIQIVYFIGCLFNSLGDFLIDTATKFFLNFGGL